MQPGDRIGGLRVEAVVAPTLFRARGRAGPLLVRLGRPDHLPRARRVVSILNGLEDPVTLEHEGWVGLLVADHDQVGLDTLVRPFDRVRVRRVFRELALRLQRVHEAGELLGGLDPAGVRIRGSVAESSTASSRRERPRTSGRDPSRVPAVDESGSSLVVLPLLHDHPAWQAPEGTASPSSDWYVFGHLLYYVLTGESFPAHGTGNAPDPRDLRAAVPGDLASLAMDLLLVDPAERCDEGEVFDVLAPLLPEEEQPDLPWLEEALARGGVVVQEDLAVEVLRRQLGSEVVDLDARPELLRVVAGADALTPVQRALVSSVLTHPEVHEPSSIERAGGLLGLALVTAGTLACHASVLDPVLLLGLSRAELAPLVIVQHRVEPEGAVSGAGDATDRLGELLALGAPVTGGWLGRLRTRWERLGWLGSAGDRALDREVVSVAQPLLWSDLERTELLAAWLERRAAARHDGPGLHAAAMLGEWFVDHRRPEGVSGAQGVAWQRLARAIRHRRAGRTRRVEAELSGELPLAEAGPWENGLARVLLADALIERGGHGRARQVLSHVREDAVRYGLEPIDRAARYLLVRTGEVGALPPEELERGLLGWWGARARSEAALWHGDPVGASVWSARAEEVLRSGPMGAGHPLLLEAAWWDRRVRCVQGTEASGHPLAPCWNALERAVVARVNGDVESLHAALEEAGHRAGGAGRELLAAACARVRGLHLGGVRGGTLVEAADQVFDRAGTVSVPRMIRMLLPELAFPLTPDRG